MADGAGGQVRLTRPDRLNIIFEFDLPNNALHIYYEIGTMFEASLLKLD